jgi:antitoxin (DNA-binding transcriptional repressor) of toxin-antitoxin stability system
MMNVSIDRIQEEILEHLHRVKAGETLVIYEADRPVAEIKPIPRDGGKKELRPFGLYAGQIKVAEDFDDPLPEEILRTFEGT